MRVHASLGVAATLLAIVVLRPHEHPQFALDHAVMLVGIVHDLAADLHVLLKRIVGGINHHAGEALINALLAQLEAVAVVEVHRDRDGAQADRRLDELLEINRMGIVPRPLGDLEHHGRLLLLAGLDDGLQQFHVVHVERAQRVLALQRLGKKVFRMGEWHKEIAVVRPEARFRTRRDSRDRPDPGELDSGNENGGPFGPPL